MSKKSLNETEICDQYITPSDPRCPVGQHVQVRRECMFTASQVLVRGKIAVRGRKKRADYLLFHTPNFPIALVEPRTTVEE